MIKSKQNIIIGFILVLLLVVVWNPFLIQNHSLTSEIHSPLALTAHMDIEGHHHHDNDAMEQNHSHSLSHDHESQFSLVKVSIAIAALLIFVIGLQTNTARHFVLGKISDTSIFLHYTLSRHKTVVLLN